MLLLIDNYDSFTYNLVHYFQCLNQEVLVYPHDKISIQQIKTLNPNHLVLSPGPKSPDEAGICLEAIRTFYKSIPLLGVCLGHQSLAQAFGGKIIQAPEIIHGKTSAIQHKGQGLFKNITTPFNATRYHSLAVCPLSLPSCFTIDAFVDDTIMAISHKQYPLFGVQFHPEAILSEYGMALLSNFLEYKNTA